MKRNFSTPIRRIDGSEFSEPQTLATVAFQAATLQMQGDDRLAGPDKLRLYQIAQKVHAGGIVDVSAEDITLLKERIGKAFAVEVVGAAYAALEDEGHREPVIGDETS
jgi:hypothetical protein